VAGFLTCGKPEDSFAAFRCTKCEQSYTGPFCYKTRLCVSCDRRRALTWTARPIANVLSSAERRIRAFTISPDLPEYFNVPGPRPNLTESTRKWSGAEGHPFPHMEGIPNDDGFLSKCRYLCSNVKDYTIKAITLEQSPNIGVLCEEKNYVQMG